MGRRRTVLRTCALSVVTRNLRRYQVRSTIFSDRVRAMRRSAAGSGGDRGKNIEHETVGRDGSDKAFADHAMAIDDVRLRYSVHTPIDAGTSLAIQADARVGIADVGENGARLGPRILPDQTEGLDASRLAKLGKLRRFRAARQAPGCKDVSHGDAPAGQFVWTETLHLGI